MTLVRTGVQCSSSSSSSSSSTEDHERGDWDASGNDAPTTNGSGPGGIILEWDEFRISVAATDWLGSGEPLQVGTFIRARVNNPGQTLDDWARI